MPIREESFRIGSGRYVQKSGAITELGAEVLKLGKRPLIIGGKTALNITREKITNSVSICEKYEIIEHIGTCNHNDANRLGGYATDNGFDVIVGVGGGVIMDFAKLISNYAALPVINVPTSSATCAAYTPLSVCYTESGQTVGTTHFTKEVDAVVVDTEILLAQPPRLFISGVFDAAAKYLEIKQRFNDDCPLGLDWAYVLAKESYKQLTDNVSKCTSDMQNGVLSREFERAVFTTICVTGVISGIARGSNQCALAHKFYEITRKMFFEEGKPYLHGEIVGVGLLLQNYFNGEKECNGFLLELMQKFGLPQGVSSLGIALTNDTKKVYYDMIKKSSAIDENNADELERLSKSLNFLWE